MKNNTFKQTEIGEIPEDWKLVELKDVLAEKGYIRGPFGSALRRPELKSKGIPVYEQQHAIYNNRDFRFFVDAEKFFELKRFQVQTDDLIISCSGTLGKVSIIAKDDPKGIISQALLTLRPDPQKISPIYLKYFFTSDKGFTSITSRSSGSVQVNIAKRQVIEQIKFSLPEISEQQHIVTILSSLDDKIELNRRMNKTLEEVGKALFKRWFVDFEYPNKNGEPYKSSGGEMVESELGNIPKGWKVGNLSDEFEILMGQSPPGSTYNENGNGLPFYQGRTDFGERFPSRRMFCSAPTRIAKKFDTLLSVRAPVGDINQANEECCIGRGVASIRKENHPTYTFYKLLYLKNIFLAYDKEGTVFGSINKTDLSKIQIILPPTLLVTMFEKELGIIDKQIFSNTTQIENLTDMRNSLLPRLMNGKIRLNI